ncbi:CLI_3235 family bacteriocin precursor [Ruminiclostridium herbifermentans]|uniref:CLI_3235 family bacteriocin n=1 Tax=Ruminiclostridium herbifermentans TaxID=2488810 RepID=A0A7H1VRI1_9FIRM|nr:CLI_3235 family bacteriocin precursor [Ruminiclostridium herbifermentans]QNU67993.1 CLI_3235 family bacteriocin precursor [Ruminiclostridium herbifermentans]
MANIKLGKKNNFENGTFMAYACNCNCFCYCSACNNCNTKTPTATGSYALKFANTTTNDTKSFTVPALLG